VKTEYVSINRDFREQHVYSSVGGIAATFAGRATLPERMKLLLQVGASARERLKTAAAEHWSVPVSEIEAQHSVLTHRPSGRTLRFGEVAASAATIRLKTEPVPKPPGQWSLLGKASPSKLNNPLIVNGSAIYGIDVRLPGMLYAALMQSPVHGGKLKRCDFDAIKNMPVCVVSRSSTPTSRASRSRHYSRAAKMRRRALSRLLPIITGRHAKRSKHSPSNGRSVRCSVEDDRTDYGAALATLEHAGQKVAKSEGNRDEGSRAKHPARRSHLSHPSLRSGTHRAAQRHGAGDEEPRGCMAPRSNNRSRLPHGRRGSRSWTGEHFLQSDVRRCSFGRRLFADDVRLVVAIAKKSPAAGASHLVARGSHAAGRYRDLTASPVQSLAR